MDVSDEAVEMMIAESLDHAFDDMSERVWTETLLKSNELVPAVHSALTMIGDQISKTERGHIQELLERVEVAQRGHNVGELKKANAALDEGTQHLATLLIERAMAEAARRRRNFERKRLLDSSPISSPRGN